MLNPSKTTSAVSYNNTEMPDFSSMAAFVLPGAFYSSCVGLLAEAGFKKAKTFEEADIVVFIGGEDINPSLYGEKAHNTTYFTDERDYVEKMYYHKALAAKVPMFGICRGAQFLHAMNGGKLWQNVNNHAGHNHLIYDVDEDCHIEATSLHHQMLRYNEKLQLIAVCDEQIATVFETVGERKHLMLGGDVDPEDVEIEIEAGAYNETQCFFVQGHPEIGTNQYRVWTMNKLCDMITLWDEQFVLEEHTL